MNFFLEMLIWVIGGLILEPILMWLADKLLKKKHKPEPIKVDTNNFAIKQSKDMIGFTWVLGLFFGIPYLGLIIAFPFFSGISKTDVVIAESIFLVIFTTITYLMFRVLTFKVEIRDEKLFIYSFFRLRKFDIVNLTTQAKSKGYYKYFEIYQENKRILKINYSMTNYELAKQRLKVTES